MQSLRGIADHGETLGGVPLGTRQRQRVRRPLAHAQEAAQAEAERGLELRQEFGLGQRQQSLDRLGPARPDHAAAAVRQRQDRDRAFLGKALVGDVIMKPLRDHDRGQRDLLIGQVLGIDARLVAHQRADAVRRHHQSRRQRVRLSVLLVTDGAGIAVDLAPADPRRRDHGDIRRTCQARPQRRADDAIRHHVSQRLETLLRGVDAGRAEAAAVGDVDPADRRRLALHCRPHAQCPESAHRAIGQCRRALVEARMLLARARRHGLDQRDAQAERRQRQGQRRADQAAADDDEIEHWRGRVHANVGGRLRRRPSPARLRPSCGAARQ